MQTRFKRNLGRVAAHGAVTIASTLFASPVLLIFGYAVTYMCMQG